MRFIIILIFVLGSCSKPKSVLMCGNSICKNQKEAQEYFDKNFTLEVKVLGKNHDKSYDLVKINKKGEFYCTDVTQALEMGFKRN